MNAPAPLSPTLAQELKSAFSQIEGLPFPVHVSLTNGSFLYANQAAARLFKLESEEDIQNFNINTCFEDPAERTHLLRELAVVAPGEWYEDLPARLHIDGEHYKIRFASRPFFEDGKLVAMLNIADSMSIIEWFAEFENEIDLGLFEVDKEWNLVDCNPAMARLMGCSSVKELTGSPVADFFWNETDLKELFSEIQEKRFVRKHQVKLRRKDDAMVIVEISCSAISWEEEHIARVKGIARDITFDIIQQVNPIGLFLVTGTPHGKDIFSRVNDTFADIHGLPSADDVLGIAADSFQSPNGNNSYLKALNDAASNNEPLLDHYMEITDRMGKLHNVVVNTRYAFGKEEKIRVGAVYDLTNHVGRNKRTLETNFSAVLHTYLATIEGLRSTLRMLLKAHGQELFHERKGFNLNQATQEVEQHKARLTDLLQQLYAVAEDRKATAPQLQRMEKFWQKATTQNESEKSNAAWIRLNLIEIKKELYLARTLNLPRELLKSVRVETEELLRLSSMISVSISLDEINERIHDMYFFRDYLRRGEVEKSDMKQANFIPILNNSIQFLEEFASINKVTIKQLFNPREVILIMCNESVLSRALHSLLHNAIKYSWNKGQERRPWVEVKVEKKNETLELIIENWGVPIRKEEFENDLIYEFGIRGKESDDRNRAGTGIGLFDARDIIVKHGGSLRITSEPTFGNLPDVYTNPFITRSYVNLPLIKP